MDEDILQEFLAESWENLGGLDSEIVSLEKDPHNDDLLASIFRTIHTIKGTCGFIGLSRLGSVAHSAENVLGQLREGRLAVTPQTVSLFLEAIDEIKFLLEGLEATSEEPARDNTGLIRRLDALAGSARDGGLMSPEDAIDDVTLVQPADPARGAPRQAARPDHAAEGPSRDGTPTEPHDGAFAKPQTPPPAAVAPRSFVNAAENTPESEPGDDGSRKSVADLSIRVNVDVLDSLMNLVGELVLTRNQLLQLARGDDESKYAAPITHLNRVTTDLQEGVMKTRMQPIGNAWSKLPRLMRDLSQLTGRQIELEMTGAETELDRTVLDAIKDPLTHMVRNSADHGIEPPDRRLAAGKPEHGTIRLNAYHEGGHVIICIEDDGAGVNTEKVLRKAVEKGLVSEAEARKMSHHEILALIFRPGFSTADQISSVSGRGVGMDVVRTAIERINGTVDVSSVAGRGTTVRIKIPLTLAIISALVVKSGDESFAIPQLGVVELVRLAAEDRGRIERIHDKEVFRLRDRLLPLVHLSAVLELDEPAISQDGDVNIVVVQVGDEQFGLIVAEVFDTEEIVVKPVGSLLKDVNVYQGTTILGDGRVIMILDVAGIAAQFGGLGANASQKDASVDADLNLDGAVTSLLLFDAGGGSPMAVPLSLVARLEEIPRRSIERSGDRLVVQYRGDLLPLLPVAGAAPATLPDPQPVVVFSEGRQSMGLMVSEILDITEERLVIRMQSPRPGVLGTAIVNGRATDVVDTQHYVLQANPGWFVRNSAQQAPRKVLVVDDSIFFRQLVTTALESEGYRVTTADSAVNALEFLEKGAKFDVVVSDIEMPQMDGIEFAGWFRSRPRGHETPLIALSSLSASALEPRALQAGFDRYLVKFNAQQLLAGIADLCQRGGMKRGVGA